MIHGATSVIILNTLIIKLIHLNGDDPFPCSCMIENFSQGILSVSSTGFVENFDQIRRNLKPIIQDNI